MSSRGAEDPKARRIEWSVSAGDGSWFQRNSTTAPKYPIQVAPDSLRSAQNPLAENDSRRTTGFPTYQAAVEQAERPI